MKTRGSFGIGVAHLQHEVNLGTLWRSAQVLGALFTFTIGKKYRPQCSDTTKSWLQIPHYHYNSIEELVIPRECKVVGIEITDAAECLYTYKHPSSAIYLLGSEDYGLSKEFIARCHDVVYIPSTISLNVAVAGSIVMYDRLCKEKEVNLNV